MHYYGTDLEMAGHYFWDIEGERMTKSLITFERIPFDPESLPVATENKNGYVEYWHFGNYTVCTILGSCYDKRPASKSVFFCKGWLVEKQMKKRILEIPIAAKIIEQMSFDVYWRY